MVPQNLNNFKNQPFHNILNTNLLNLWNEAAPAVMVVAVMVVAVANNHGNGFLLYLLLSCLLHNVNHNWTENLTFSKFVLRANIKKSYWKRQSYEILKDWYCECSDLFEDIFVKTVFEKENKEKENGLKIVKKYTNYLTGRKCMKCFCIYRNINFNSVLRFFDSVFFDYRIRKKEKRSNLVIKSKWNKFSVSK